METGMIGSSVSTPFNFPRSTSQRRTYRECGYKYLLKYGQGWGQRQNKGRYRFGDVMQYVADMIITGQVESPSDAEAAFLRGWDWVKAEGDALWWSKKHTWDYLRARGRVLAGKMVLELAKRIPLGEVDDDGQPIRRHLNERLVYELGGDRELAIPDYVGLCQRYDFERQEWGDTLVWTVLDYKTADQGALLYSPDTVAERDEQLTDYQLAVEARLDVHIEQVGLVVLDFRADPGVWWRMAPRRDDETIAHFRAGAGVLHSLIRNEVFSPNDRRCHDYGGCEMMPLCFSSQRKLIAEKLTRRDDKPTLDELALDLGE